MKRVQVIVHYAVMFRCETVVWLFLVVYDLGRLDHLCRWYMIFKLSKDFVSIET